MSYKQPLAPTAPPAEAVVVTVEPRTTADELRMGATAMAPDQHEIRFQTDVGECFNHSDYIGTGLASFCCPCHMCGQLLEKQGHRGRHRGLTICCSLLFVASVVLLILSAFLRACASSALAVGAVLAGIFLLGLYCVGWSLRRRIRRKWGIPSPRCAYGLEAFDVCCWCAGCDDCCCMLWCGPCALDQLARQEYLASNGYSVEYDFYAATGLVPGVQYARPLV